MSAHVRGNWKSTNVRGHSRTSTFRGHARTSYDLEFVKEAGLRGHARTPSPRGHSRTFSFQFLRPEFKVFSKKKFRFRISCQNTPCNSIRGLSRAFGFRISHSKFQKNWKRRNTAFFFANYLITLVADSGYSDVALLLDAFLQGMLPQERLRLPLPFAARHSGSGGAVLFV